MRRVPSKSWSKLPAAKWLNGTRVAICSHSVGLMRPKDAHARRRVEVAHSSALQERSALTILRLRQDKLHRLTCPERKKIVQCRRGTPAKITEKCLTLSGSSAYRAEDGRDDDRGRDRSPLRSEERRENTGYSQTDSKKQKLAFGFGKKSAQPESKKGIQIKLGSTSKPNAKPAASFQKPTVASVFNADDDDDEPEEMPAEARMRMRNIGRETPTSAGPNSFGKTKQGFCDSKKIFEKTLKKAMEEANK